MKVVCDKLTKKAKKKISLLSAFQIIETMVHLSLAAEEDASILARTMLTALLVEC